MADKYYYKIVNDNTGLVECYVSVALPVKADKLCELLDIKGHHAESATIEEYVRETEDNYDE